MHPYHLQRVQALRPTDYPRRVRFCQWFVDQVNDSFLSKILFTDEAQFSRSGIRNLHSLHLWAAENPHGFRDVHFQDNFSLNV
ncbi:hypothetical protein BDFB_006420 [Asbolus verrucosus]|uniref:DDE 3 domain containing protein n=1 Tax=Asbolus verrucosus TaxID=1661398 RepID=A0A482VA28_ASBVE|nr:hypothetical protein BDFB_006420 [Asbolus verrucosus]